MLSHTKKSIINLIVFSTLLIVLFSSSSNAQPPAHIELRIGDVVAFPGQTVEIPIYLNLNLDTLIGFQIWLQNDRPDIMEYNYVLNRNDGPIGDWGFYTNNSGGLFQDMLLTAAVNLVDNEPLNPTGNEIYLMGFYVNVFNIPDTTSERTVEISVNTDFLDNFNFANIHGNSIGIETVEVLDTNWFNCTSWAGETCLNWIQVAGPPADSFSVETILIAVLDTFQVKVQNGSLTVRKYKCGDLNLSNSVDISDLTFFIAYMFTGGPPPLYDELGDCNGDGNIDVSDLTCFVCYLFDGCPPPVCAL